MGLIAFLLFWVAWFGIGAVVGGYLESKLNRRRYDGKAPMWALAAFWPASVAYLIAKGLTYTVTEIAVYFGADREDKELESRRDRYY